MRQLDGCDAAAVVELANDSYQNKSLFDAFVVNTRAIAISSLFAQNGCD